ncbi:unnamed protein product, partial [Callosobruchus maculatus]
MKTLDALNNPDILTCHIYVLVILQERQAIILSFSSKSAFPGYLGCIDCTHVVLVKPREHKERFFNRKHYEEKLFNMKHYHSGNVQINFLGRNLFSYHMELNDILDPVVRCINYIRAKALNTCQFRLLFEEEIRECGELQVYCAVRWLSRRNMLRHFFNLREEALQLLEEKGASPLEVDLLKNTSWLTDLAFSVDITNDFNILNLKLQDKDCSLTTILNFISGFKAKPDLFLINLATENIHLFSTLKHLKEELHTVSVNYSKYESKMKCLLQSLERGFQDFENLVIISDKMKSRCIKNVNDKVRYLNDILLKLFSKHAPVRTVRITKKKAPWLMDTIKIMQIKRDKALIKYRASKEVADFNYYKLLRNE